MLKEILLILSIVAFVGCGEQQNNNEAIHGNWKAISWEASGIETLEEGTNVEFQFNDDDTYAATLGQTTSEKGIYRLDGTKLYTTAEGQIEKMVETELSSSDTLTIFMNRSGTSETMILLKQK